MHLKPTNQIPMKTNGNSSSNPRSPGSASQISAATCRARASTSAANNTSSNGHIESSIRDNRNSRTTFECHPDEILKAIGVASGLCISTRGNERSNPQEDSPLSSSSRYRSPTIVESVLAKLPPSTPTVETNSNVLGLIDDMILSRTGHTSRPRRRRARRRAN